MMKESVTLEESKTSLSLSRLPTDIMVNILYGLPVKTIFYCRCVCKTWRNLLLDPYFAKLHSVPVDLLLFTVGHDRVHTRDFRLCGINAGQAREHGNNTVVKFNTRFDIPTSLMRVVGSCNGLLCISGGYTYSDFLFICNPITREYIILPGREKQGLGYEAYIYMFGYSSHSNQYKVMRIAYRYGRVVGFSKGDIYTLGTNTWSRRSVGDIPYPSSTNLYGIPLNGAVHWKSINDIWSFDIENEQIQSIPVPSQLKIDDFCLLGALGSCLSVYKSYYHQLDIWVMKDYGVKESWTKDYVIKKSEDIMLRPITMQEDGSILILHNYRPFLYNPRTEEFRMIKIDGIQSELLCQPILHLPNFLSLKDIFKGDCFRILNVKS